MQGDLLLLAAGDSSVVNKALDKVRQFLAKDLGLIQKEHALLWVVDFPMYEWNGDEERLEVTLSYLTNLHQIFFRANLYARKLTCRSTTELD